MKVAIYCRLSDEDRDKLFQNDDSASIQNQKAMLIQFASSNGWIIHDIYSDDRQTRSIDQIYAGGNPLELFIHCLTSLAAI